MKHKNLNPDGARLAIRARTHREYDYAHCEIALCTEHQIPAPPWIDEEIVPGSLPFMHPMQFWSVCTQMSATHEDPPNATFYALEHKWGTFGGFEYYELDRVHKTAKALRTKLAALERSAGHPVTFAEHMMRMVQVFEIERLYHRSDDDRRWLVASGGCDIRSAFDWQERIARSLMFPTLAPIS